jgi:hypothetical protein
MTSASAGFVIESRIPAQITGPGQVELEPAAAATDACKALGHRDPAEHQFGESAASTLPAEKG